MFTINGHIISSYKDFCDHFEYVGVVRQIREFAVWLDGGRRYLLTIQKDIDPILKLLQYADDESGPVMFHSQDGCFTSDFSSLTDQELLAFFQRKEALVRRFDDLVGASTLTESQKRRGWLEGVAVSAAAASDAAALTAEKIEACYSREEAAPYTLPEQIQVFSGDICEYEVFDPDRGPGTPFVLRTHRIKNCSSYAGTGAVIRLVRKGAAEYETILEKDEYVYLTMAGPYAVKMLPRLSFCGSTAIGRPDLRKNTLWRYKVDRIRGRISGSEVLDLLPDKHISCISVDYRGGLIYIQEGCLKNDSAVFYEGLYSPTLKEIRFVEAYVRKTRFLLLDENGNTYSNIPAMDGLHEIYRIDMEGAVAAASRTDGETMTAVVYEEEKRFVYEREKGTDIREQCFDQELAAVFTRSGDCMIVRAKERE